MTDTDLQIILSELDAAHRSTGYAGATTFSEAAKAIRHLLHTRNALLVDLHFSEVPC